MSLVRRELPRWSIKYWRNNLYSWRPHIAPRRDLFFPLSSLGLGYCYLWRYSMTFVLLWWDKSLTPFVKFAPRWFAGWFRWYSWFLRRRREFFADGMLSCGPSETTAAWLRDVLIWKYSMQERGAINGRLLPPGFMNSCLLEVY